VANPVQGRGDVAGDGDHSDRRRTVFQQVQQGRQSVSPMDRTSKAARWTVKPSFGRGPRPERDCSFSNAIAPLSRTATNSPSRTQSGSAREARAMSAKEALRSVPCRLHNRPAPARTWQRHPSNFGSRLTPGPPRTRWTDWHRARETGRSKAGTTHRYPARARSRGASRVFTCVPGCHGRAVPRLCSSGGTAGRCGLTSRTGLSW
jgi:hypothetical protein